MIPRIFSMILHYITPSNNSFNPKPRFITSNRQLSCGTVPSPLWNPRSNKRSRNRIRNRNRNSSQDNEDAAEDAVYANKIYHRLLNRRLILTGWFAARLLHYLSRAIAE